MKSILILLICALCLAPADAAQRRKKSTRAKRAPASRKTVETRPAAKSIGSPVVIVTRNGDRITGTLRELTAYSITVKSGDLESTIALETIASLAFGDAPAGSKPEPPASSLRPDFAQDAAEITGAFRSFGSETKAGIDYTEYGRQLTELRRKTDRFVQRYAGSEHALEARVVALVAGAATDYTWARTVWTLKLGRSGEHTVNESDSPVVADALSLYPDLRTAAAEGTKYSADRIVAGLWKKAADRIDRARAALGPVR